MARPSPKADAVRTYLSDRKLTTPDETVTIQEVTEAIGISGSYASKLIKQFNTPADVFAKAANSRQVGGSHYKNLAIEPWDAAQAWLSKEEFVGFLKGNIIKYIARTKNANDLDKAAHYMQKLMEVK